MFDGDGLKLSRFYFDVLQLLRTAASWIQESMEDLRRTVDHIEWLYYLSDIDHLATHSAFREDMVVPVEVFRQNWDSVLSHHRLLGNALLDRIANKHEEVKNLQDRVRHVPPPSDGRSMYFGNTDRTCISCSTRLLSTKRRRRHC